MRLFDVLTGTKRPSTEVTPLSTEDVRAALLGLNRPENPWTVRDGAAEGADLVAEWRIMEPAWRSFFAAQRVSRVLKIRMRLVPADHEVRALEQQKEVTWVGDTPSLRVSRTHSRGPAKTVSRHWSIGRQDDGRLAVTETFSFNSSDMRDPVQDAALAAGWTWRGVVFGKL